ncbi:MAG: sigma-70 family RNA polymerase sigma factor [Rubripirellula sp.]
MSVSDLDEEMIARLETGDEHAFVEIFSQHRDRLKQMLQFRMDPRLRGREDASDIVQEVYIDAYQRMRHYLRRPELSFYIWLRQLTTQRLIDIHRKHLKAEMRDVKQEVSIRRHGVESSSESMAIQLVAQLVSPSQTVMREELLEQIRTVLDDMDEVDREIIALRHFEELKNNEVAEVLGLKQAAASNRYMRALSRLREALQDLPGFMDEDL